MFLKRKVDSKPKQNRAHLAAIRHQFEINVGLGIIYAGIPKYFKTMDDTANVYLDGK